MAHPKRSFHLIDAFDGTDGVTKSTIQYQTRQNGMVRTGFYTLNINEDYSLDDGQTPNDETFIKSLQNYTSKIRYTAELENRLKKYGISYTIDRCKACGGRAKKLVFHPVEVVL